MKTLVVITGPTAVGKTTTAIQLAQHFNTEIISADSRQIFIETKIGTAVPNEDELTLVKHHFIGTRHVTDYYNAWQFEQDALQKADELFQKHDIVILAGGSGLYVDAVCNGIDEIPDIEPDLRKRINSQYEKEGIESLRQTLKFLDPEYYKIVDLSNPARLKRAIEICFQTGKTYSELRKENKKTRPFKIIKIALNREREALYERINQRVDQMISDGLEQEVKSLSQWKDCTALKTVGYREFFDYFDGLCTYTEAIEKIKQNTRKYAKKQISWIKRDSEYQWFSPNEINEMIQYIEFNNGKPINND
ncbi:MAG: tRNA (adenosine(37)-N6)-dimethylallyltransferase MiaA [Bacteroidales bacterium]|nr:tRNA (adenosine(37)-N6)-dimethylallyltransferase MiaA [Bacteroidales bacterium]